MLIDQVSVSPTRKKAPPYLVAGQWARENRLLAHGRGAPWTSHRAVSSAGGDGTSQVLAKDSQSKRSDVLKRAGRDPRRDRTVGVRQDHGAALPAAGQVCLQPPLPGTGGAGRQASVCVWSPVLLA